jgi:hypothetical protein
MANPSEKTLNTVDFYMDRIYPREKLGTNVLSSIIDAAGVMVDYLPTDPQEDDESLIHFIRNTLYPKNKNVHYMDGQPKATGYVISHITSAGLATEAKNTAYFDSLGAQYHDTINHRNGYGEKLPYLLGAMMLKSAATRSVINSSGKLKEVDIIQVGKDIVFMEDLALEVAK